MKQAIRSYHYFLHGISLQVFTYVLYPIFVLLLGCFVSHVLGRHITLSLLFVGSWLVVIEYLLDYFSFGGILSKETNKFTYLCTSTKGMPLLTRAVNVDFIRRAFMVMLLIPCTHLRQINESTIWQISSSIFFTLLFVELGIFMARYLSSITIIGIFISVSCCFYYLLLAFQLYLISLNTIFAPLATILYAAASLLVHIIERNLIIKKARNSLYDE